MAPIIETVLHPLPFLPDNASPTVPRILPAPAVHRTFRWRPEVLVASPDPCAEPHVPKTTPETRRARDGNHRTRGWPRPTVPLRNPAAPILGRKQAKENPMIEGAPEIRIDGPPTRPRGVGPA